MATVLYRNPFVAEIIDASALGKSLLKDGVFPESAVRMPDLDPTTRTERQSSGYQLWRAPGPDAGTVEFRRRIGTFDDGNGGRNAVMTEGWNIADAGNGQINSLWGSCRWGLEHSFYQSGTRTSEIHNAEFTKPGGTPKRAFTSQMRWDTGYYGAIHSGTAGDLRYDPLVGSSVQLISWDGSPSMNVGGNGFYYGDSGSYRNRQINGAGTYFVGLPYVSGNDVVLGFDPGVGAFGLPAIGVARGLRFLVSAAADIPTPAAGYKTLFVNSSGGGLAFKDESGTVTAA